MAPVSFRARFPDEAPRPTVPRTCQLIDFEAARAGLRSRGDLSGINRVSRAASLAGRAAWDEGMRYLRRAQVLADAGYRVIAQQYRCRADLYLERGC